MDGRHRVEVGVDGLAGPELPSTMPTPSARAHRVGLVDAADAAALAVRRPRPRSGRRRGSPGGRLRGVAAAGAGGGHVGAEDEPGGSGRTRADRPSRRSASGRRRRTRGPAGASPSDAADRGDPRAGVRGVRSRPSLPAAATTTMSASAAPSRARSTVSMPGGPPTARLSTSTPSAVARSIAVTRSAVAQPSSPGSGARPARLVDGDPGLRGDAAEPADGAALHPHADPGVAGRDRGHLGAVADGVARRQVLGAADPVLAEAGDEPPRADDLAVAGGRGPLLAAPGTSPEKSSGRPAEAGDAGEQRGLGRRGRSRRRR